MQTAALLDLVFMKEELKVVSKKCAGSGGNQVSESCLELLLNWEHDGDLLVSRERQQVRPGLF